MTATKCNEVAGLLEQLEPSESIHTRQSAAHKMAQLFASSQDGVQYSDRTSALTLLVQLAKDDCEGQGRTLTLQLVLSCITNLHAQGHYDPAGVAIVTDLVVQAILASDMLGDEATLGYALAAAMNLTSTPSGAELATRLVAVGCVALLKERCCNLGGSQSKVDRVICRYADGLIKNMKRYAKKVNRNEKGIAKAAMQAAAKVVQATAAANTKQAAGPGATPATDDALESMVRWHQMSPRRCRPPLPTSTSSQRVLEKSPSDRSIRRRPNVSTRASVRDAAGAPLDRACTGNRHAASEAKIANALASSPTLRQLSPAACQPGTIGSESSRAMASLHHVDVAAARIRARQARAEDTVDIMQRVPAYKVPFKPAYTYDPISASCSPQAPVRRSSVLPPIGASWGPVQLQAY